MGLNTDTLERQLAIATGKLEDYVKQLDEKGVAAAARKRDSIWRKLDAARRALRNRVIAAEAVLAREAECAKRKEAATAE
jgi:hypothetical protein